MPPRVLAKLKRQAPHLPVARHGDLEGLLTTDTGLHFTLRTFRRTPLVLGEWLLYPQQTIDLHWPDSALGLLALGLATALAGGLVATAMWPRENRALHLVALAWIGVYVAMIAVAGQVNSWYPYTAVPALALIIASLISHGVRVARSRGPGVLPAVGLAAAAYAGVAIMIPSPVFRDYRAWVESDGVGRAVTASALEVARETDPDVGIVLLNTPSHVRESDGGFLVTRSAAIHWPYSLARWLEIQGVERVVVVLGSSRHQGSVRIPCVAFRATDRLRVYFTTDGSDYDNSPPRRAGERLSFSVGRGFEFRWPPGELSDRPLALLLFDGTHYRPVPIGTATTETCPPEEGAGLGYRQSPAATNPAQ